MFHYKPLGYCHFTNLHMIGPYQNVLFFSLCQSLSTCNSFSFSPPLDFGALALGRSWLSWGSLSMENRGKLILWFETTRQWWSQWWSMKNWQKIIEIPHISRKYMSRLPSLRPSSLLHRNRWPTEWRYTKALQLSPVVQTYIPRSLARVRTRKTCEVTKITVGVNIKNKPMSYKSKSNHCVLRESEMEF